MIPVTRFQAADGAEFQTEDDCLAYEVLCAELAGLELLLEPRPEIPGYTNGYGYVQHDRASVFSFQLGLVRILSRAYAKELAAAGNGLQQHFDYATACVAPAGRTFLARLVDDAGPGALRRAWHRLACIDAKYREWGQPYYAIEQRPDAVIVCLNPKVESAA